MYIPIRPYTDKIIGITNSCMMDNRCIIDGDNIIYNEKLLYICKKNILAVSLARSVNKPDAESLLMYHND